MRVLDAYPGGAVRGGDLIDGSSSPNRSFEPIHQDRWGTAYRPERVLATGVYLDDLDKIEGEVCFSESTIRSFGQLMGLVPIETLHAAEAVIVALRDQLAASEDQLAQLTVVDAVVEQAVQKALADLAPQLVGLVADATQAPEPTETPTPAPPPSDRELAAAARRRK